MRPVLVAFGRAMLSQLHVRMLLLTVLPFLVSLAIWGAILYVGLQPLIDWGYAWFVAHDAFRLADSVLAPIGAGFATKVIVPLLAMWVLLPLMILTALVFIGVLAMPIIIRHVGGRHFPQLEKRRGGSIGGSLWLSLSSFVVFALLWLLTLPLSALPPLGFVAHLLLWGWLTYRVLAYDALADHADKEEWRAIRHLHRWPLLAIGTATAFLGAAPTLLWLGGVLSMLLLPLFAALSIWLYVLVFIFSGLWFEYYCLEALARYRMQPPMQDIN
ncbi:MAG: EI24 domain-containing protein [Proteobacteria bacterium]|nr:EI24 domain-containing protein [Pseudomonadota bacterium]